LAEDLCFKIVTNLAALVLMVMLGRKIAQARS
jgi:hypothetical protein